MTIDPGDENAAADTVNGVYEKHHTLKPGEKVLDLGAHAGYFSLKASRLVGEKGQVVAFEPHPWNYSRLIVRCKLPNVRCVEAGAWDEDGQGDLWELIGNNGGHSFFHIQHGQKPNPIKCRLVDIGKWLEAEGFKPDFVKVDTELSEFRILTSIMRTNLRPEFAAETHGEPTVWDSCARLLKHHGYTVKPDRFTNNYLYAWK